MKKIIHPIAKDGYKLAFILFAFAYLISRYDFRMAIPFFAIGIFSLYFFRDPKRVIISDPGTILAAADGKIKAVDEFYEPIFLKEDAVRIVTFLSITNVHINRSPIDGTVLFQMRESGKHHPAYLEKAKKNGKNYIGIANDDISVLTIQMVGRIARRIVSWVDIGKEVPRGDKIGLIRFGSRTDVIIPKSKIKEILVRPGDKVKAGESVIAVIKKDKCDL